MSVYQSKTKILPWLQGTISVHATTWDTKVLVTEKIQHSGWCLWPLARGDGQERCVAMGPIESYNYLGWKRPLRPYSQAANLALPGGVMLHQCIHPAWEHSKCQIFRFKLVQGKGYNGDIVMLHQDLECFFILYAAVLCLPREILLLKWVSVSPELVQIIENIG